MLKNMLRLLRKGKSQTQINIAESSQTHLFVALLKSRPFCSATSVNSRTRSSSCITSSGEQQSSSTVGDLINSHGLSRQIPYNSSNSVPALFERHGFSQSQIETIVSRLPRIVTFDAEGIIKPKIDFFRSVGIFEADVAKMITMSPHILYRSLKDHLIPSFDLLTNLLEGEHTAVCTIKRFPSILVHDVRKNLEPNLSSLRKLGIPESRISKFMVQWGMITVIVRTPNEWFSKAAGAVVKMDFDPYSSSFAHAVRAMAWHNKESDWERKLEFYRSLGFSDKEILSIFRKQPISMELSEKKIRGAVEFFVNKFHWSPSQFSARPNVITYSLEKRIIPRCSVLQLLVSRHRIHKNVSVLTILVPTEKDFVGRYVTEYKEEVPEVLDAYEGKLKFDEYNFDVGELRG